MTDELVLEDEDGEEVKLPGLPPNTKNYMTPACYRRLLDEREQLVNVERPSIVNVVSCKQRRPIGKRRLPVRQAAPARDRPPHPFSE